MCIRDRVGADFVGLLKGQSKDIPVFRVGSLEAGEVSVGKLLLLDDAQVADADILSLIHS